jgi:hypothetical protein
LIPSVTTVIVPIQSIVENLRPSSIQDPIKLHLDVLNQVARDLDMPSIGRVPLWPDIIMLHQTGSVEVMNEWGRCLVRWICCVVDWIVEDGVCEILFRIKVFVDGIDLRNVAYI